VGAQIVAVMNGSDTQDRWIQDAAISAAASHDTRFLAALSSLRQTPSAQAIEAAAIVAEHYARGGPVESVAELIAGLTTAHEQTVDAVIQGLVNGWPADKKPQLDDKLESEIRAVGERLSPGSRGLLVKLARGWGSRHFEQYSQQVSEALLNELDDESLELDKRLEAARQLVEFRPTDQDVATELLDRISPQSSPSLASGIVMSLRSSEAPEVGSLLTARLPGFTPATRTAGISLLLSRPSSTASLLDAIDEGVVQLGELSLDQKQALATHPNRRIRRRAQRLLERGGALPNADRQAVLDQLLPITMQTGDPAAGKEVFKKQCSKCHMHSGEGANIGPDLTGMAVHPKAELLTHIIDPSSSVEGNYRVYTVITDDGLVMNGLLASESRTAIELFDAEGQKRVILREDVDELIASPKSIMPEGFEKQMSEQEICNLLEFLTQRGKYVPLNIGKVATITSARGMFIDQQSRVERLIFPDWASKSFNGVPFHLTDPKDGDVANVILLNGPLGEVSSKMPKSVQLPCNGAARAIHFLSGISGWGHPFSRQQTVSMIVRLKYHDGKTEDHELLNGVHFADYIRRVDVPGSEFAFRLRGRQIRYLAIHPERPDAVIDQIEIIKGPDRSAPVVMAVTVESATDSLH
jgi:putative heme-binding domain-containing protein